MALNPFQLGTRVYRSPDGDGSGGGGSGSGTGGTGGDGDGGSSSARSRERADERKARRVPRMFSPNVEGQFRGFVSRYGEGDDALEAAARYMWSELYQVRRKNVDLREQLDEFAKRVPPDSVVLLGAEATALNALKKHGKLTDIPALLTQLAELQGKEAQRAAEQVRADAAKATGFNRLVLEDRLERTGLQLEVREEAQQDGSKKKVPYVRKANDDKAPWEALSIVASRDWKDYLTALRAAPASGSTQEQHDSSGSADEQSYVEFPETGAAGGDTPTGTSAVDKFIKNRDEGNKKRPNPLGAARQGA